MTPNEHRMIEGMRRTHGDLAGVLMKLRIPSSTILSKEIGNVDICSF